MKVTKEMKPLMPWVIVGPAGVRWLGHASCEADAWEIALGWPSPEEIAEHKKKGFYAAEATVSWKQGEHKREWVGLTDEDCQPAVRKAMVYYGYDSKYEMLTSGAGFYELARTIEAKLKEKNT